MKSTITNWNNNLNINQLTLLDKIKKLLSQSYKLVLVQKHELERLRVMKNRIKHATYINNLYEHYEVNKLGKTYLIN